MQHQADLTRPWTEIERIIRSIEPKLPDELPQRGPERVQVPGFRNPNDPRIPTALRNAALVRALHRKKGGGP